MHTNCTAAARVPYRLDGQTVNVWTDCLKAPGHNGDHDNGRFIWRATGDSQDGVWVRDR